MGNAFSAPTYLRARCFVLFLVFIVVLMACFDEELFSTEIWKNERLRHVSGRSWGNLTNRLRSRVDGNPDDNPDGNTTNDSINRYYGWGPEGINLEEHVLRFINLTYNHPERLVGRLQLRFQPLPGFLVVLKNSKPSLYFPQRIMSAIATYGGNKLIQSGLIKHWQHAFQDLLRDHQDDNRFSSLLQALSVGGSLPILFDFFDYYECADPKGNLTNLITNPNRRPENKGLPVMAFAKSVSCSYGFPVPTYATYKYAMMYTTTPNVTWTDKMQEWSQKFPWKEKIAKAYWRGHSERGWRPQFMKETQRYPEFVDVKSKYKHGEKLDPMETSMRFKAVFDLDGVSWSERFPRLMCYNSAIIKVNVPDDFEEYFARDLVPGVHFIPASLENASEVARLALQHDNDDVLQRIVQNANEWCRKHMHVETLNLDFLSVVSGYVEMMNRNDSNWINRWEEVKEEYIGSNLGGFVDGLGNQIENLMNATPLDN